MKLFTALFFKSKECWEITMTQAKVPDVMDFSSSGNSYERMSLSSSLWSSSWVAMRMAHTCWKWHKNGKMLCCGGLHTPHTPDAQLKLSQTQDLITWLVCNHWAQVGIPGCQDSKRLWFVTDSLLDLSMILLKHQLVPSLRHPWDVPT